MFFAHWDLPLEPLCSEHSIHCECPPEFKIKALSSHLKHTFLGDCKTLPVNIIVGFIDGQEKALLATLKAHRGGHRLDHGRHHENSI